ncbi:hypothetical protein [Streptomyces sp. NPDC005485]|uniref:hypothetical protein n=1 Tax=Streptomyces sp. NPDC005485 TaxID=3155591 RepID=UPI0033AB2F53
MAKNRSRGRIYGLWITAMIFISGRVTVGPYLEGHRIAQEVAIFGLLMLVYLLGFAGGSRSTIESDQKPPERASDQTEGPLV